MVKQPFGGSIGGWYTKCHIYIIYMIHIDTSLVVQRCCATWPMNLSKAYHWNSGRRSPCLLVCSLSIPDMCNISCTLPRIRYDMHFFLCPLESLKSTLNSFKEINQNRNYTTKKNLQKWIYIYTHPINILWILCSIKPRYRAARSASFCALVFGATNSFSKSIPPENVGKMIEISDETPLYSLQLGPNNIGFKWF